MYNFFGKYEKLIKNFASLFILQGLNYILPLITIPYLTRVLGPTNYGKTIFATSIITFFQVFIDYGFNLSATRNISINSNNKLKVSEIFSNVIFIKIIFSLMGFILLIILTFNIARFKEENLLYYFTYLGIFGNALFPIWLFQGLEEMSYITKLNILLKTLSTFAIFLFIHNEKDYLYLPLINSIILILIGIYSLFFISKKLNIKFSNPNFTKIKSELKDGWYIFITTFFSNILANIGNFFIGLFLGDTAVGYYGAINKITKTIISMFNPVITAIYPFLTQIMKKKKAEGIKELINIGRIIMFFAIIISVLTYIFSNMLIIFLCGEEYLLYSKILKIESIWIVFSILNNLIGIQFLINMGKGKEYSKCFLTSGIIMLILSFSLMKYLGVYTTSISMLISEILLTFLMVILIKRENMLV